MRRSKRCLAMLLLLSLAICGMPINAYALDPSDSDQEMQEYYQSVYGWDKDKLDEETWTGIDGEDYSRTNPFESSMYKDVKTTTGLLAVDLGLITSLSGEGGLGGYGGGTSIVAVARKELEAGVRETPLGSNYTKYHAAYGISACAWCALFVSWCADQCGYLDSGLYTYSLTCIGMYNHMTSVNGFNSFTVRSAKPFGGSNEVREGDLVFWIKGGEYSHIGIVSGVTDSTISIISGNAGSGEDSVSESTYNAGSANYASLWGGYIVSMQYPQSGADPIFNYLRNVLGTSVAGACGALANIEAESNFVADIEETANGIGYGICQWSFSRRTELVNFCNYNGLDYRTLDGQLAFLGYELTSGGYNATYNAIMNADESSDGAYDAGYTWCVDFERPENMKAKGRQRGSVAANTYWPQYGGRAN